MEEPLGGQRLLPRPRAHWSAHRCDLCKAVGVIPPDGRGHEFDDHEAAPDAAVGIYHPLLFWRENPEDIARLPLTCLRWDYAWSSKYVWTHILDDPRTQFAKARRGGNPASTLEALDAHLREAVRWFSAAARAGDGLSARRVRNPIEEEFAAIVRRFFARCAFIARARCIRRAAAAAGGTGHRAAAAAQLAPPLAAAAVRESDAARLSPDTSVALSVAGSTAASGVDVSVDADAPQAQGARAMAAPLGLGVTAAAPSATITSRKGNRGGRGHGRGTMATSDEVALLPAAAAAPPPHLAAIPAAPAPPVGGQGAGRSPIPDASPDVLILDNAAASHSVLHPLAGPLSDVERCIRFLQCSPITQRALSAAILFSLRHGGELSDLDVAGGDFFSLMSEDIREITNIDHMERHPYPHACLAGLCFPIWSQGVTPSLASFQAFVNGISNRPVLGRDAMIALLGMQRVRLAATHALPGTPADRVSKLEMVLATLIPGLAVLTDAVLDPRTMIDALETLGFGVVSYVSSAVSSAGLEQAIMESASIGAVHVDPSNIVHMACIGRDNVVTRVMRVLEPSASGGPPAWKYCVCDRNSPTMKDLADIEALARSSAAVMIIKSVPTDAVALSRLRQLVGAEVELPPYVPSPARQRREARNVGDVRPADEAALLTMFMGRGTMLQRVGGPRAAPLPPPRPPDAAAAPAPGGTPSAPARARRMQRQRARGENGRPSDRATTQSPPLPPPLATARSGQPGSGEVPRARRLRRRERRGGPPPAARAATSSPPLHAAEPRAEPYATNATAMHSRGAGAPAPATQIPLSGSPVPDGDSSQRRGVSRATSVAAVRTAAATDATDQRIICQKCNRPGHAASDCTANMRYVKCQICNRHGHVATVCRGRESGEDAAGT